MNRKDRNFRKTMLRMVIIMLAGLAIWNGAVFLTFQHVSETYYNAVASFIWQAKEQYPEIKEEEWIRLLREETASEEARGLLARYGIFPEDMPIQAANRDFVWLLAGGNIIWILLCLGLLLTFIRYQNRQDRSLRELTEYIRQVEHGVYQLDMEENEEGSLSGLKNELYKITVMLREAAELSGRQKKALADSVSDISHQLKTPLTSSLLLLDNLTESEHMEEVTRRKFLLEITRQITHVNWLVASLLKLSRLDAGVVEMKMEPVPVDSLLEQGTEALTMTAEWKQIVFRISGSTDAILQGDFQWLKEALMNLMKNAVEHSPAASEVLLQAEDNAVYTAISVKDYGEGISPEEQKHIFERFYRSSTASEDSVGIGLALAKEIVERHNGYLTVDSRPGAGTVFTMKFLKCH